MDLLKIFKSKSNKKEGGRATGPSSASQKDAKKLENRKKPTTRAGIEVTTGTASSRGPSNNNNNVKSDNKRWYQTRTPKFNTKSASSPSLESVEAVNSTKVPKKKRPISANLSNVTVRRGPTSSSSSANGPLEDSSRASSSVNINVAPQSFNPKSSAIGGTKPKHVAPPITTSKNNNKESELDVLRKELSKMSAEKANLSQQLTEKDGQVILLRQEVAKLKKLQDDAVFQLGQMGEENSTLRNRLRDVSHSPLSDNEKQQLLFESRHHNSAPASITTNVFDNNGEVSADWDKRSSSGNVGEVSVACLQDKIHQMQETNASTNEELQATLQELTDLQTQLTELQQENERLNDDYKLMYDSVCRQNVRLVDSRSEVESLKQLLYKGDAENAAAEREEKLVDLLKLIQEERDTLAVKLERLQGDFEEIKMAQVTRLDEMALLRERVETLERALDAKHAEHKQLDRELALVRDQSSSKQIEITRLKDLLENARTKICELEQERDFMGDKSELDEMLDNVRKEKDGLESEVAHLKEQLALSRNESDKLTEQVSILREECKVVRNNAKTTRCDLEYKVDLLLGEKNGLEEKLEQFQEALNDLQVQAQYQLDDKRQLGAVLSETQRSLNEAEAKIIDLDNQLTDVRKSKEEQQLEWEHFQNDLLTTVRIANEFKIEAQEDLQRMILENKAERERVKQLEAQIDKLKVSTTPCVALNVEELAVRRQKQTLQRQCSRQSVKSLIECIEGQAAATQPSKLTSLSTSNLSRSSSTSSVSSDMKTPTSPSQDDWSNEVKTPLKEQQQPNKLVRDWSKTKITDSLVKNNNINKSLDFARRNSYSDLSDRKDPLNGLFTNGGSKRNALLKWCQNKTVGYRNIDITNFSSSWNDGLALCALLHTYLPDKIPYDSLTPIEKRRNFSLAFNAAESVGIPTTLNVNDMIQLERPDWQQVMGYVTAIYKHFET